MSHEANVLHIRISRLLPQALKRALHPAELHKLCETAAANGWHDAEWLAGYALEGHDHPSVTNPAAVFITRLREISTAKCPGISDQTPTPPPVTDVLNIDPRNIANEATRTKAISAIRKQLNPTNSH